MQGLLYVQQSLWALGFDLKGFKLYTLNGYVFADEDCEAVVGLKGSKA
jgi:hypothetical protein